MLKRYHALRLIKDIFGTKHGYAEKKWQGTNQINNCAIILQFECVSTASITFIELTRKWDMLENISLKT